MKKNIITFAILLLAPLCIFAADGEKKAKGKGKKKAVEVVEESGKQRKVAIQMYSLRTMSFEEALEKLAPLGVKYVQGFPGQYLKKEDTKTKTNFLTMTAEDKAFMKELLAKHNIKMIDYGVCSPKKTDDIKKLFEFAKEMDIPNLTTESPATTFATYNKLGAEYKIKVGVHNHTVDPKKEKGYGDPKNVLEFIKDFEWVGAEPDNGHWCRSGIDNIESLKLLKGRITNIHFKDMPAFNDMSAVSCPYGKGTVDLKAILAELDSQGWDGYLIMEFDGKGGNPMKSISTSLKYLKTLK